MGGQILTALILAMTCAIGIWKFVARLKSEKRKLVDEAKKQYEEAMRTNDASAITAALARLQRIK